MPTGEQKINPDQLNFLKEHEALLERAKNGDVEALDELQKGTGEILKTTTEPKSLENHQELPNSTSPFVSPELKSNDPVELSSEANTNTSVKTDDSVASMFKEYENGKPLLEKDGTISNEALENLNKLLGKIQ